jgi:hypothetical protein
MHARKAGDHRADERSGGQCRAITARGRRCLGAAIVDGICGFHRMRGRGNALVLGPSRGNGARWPIEPEVVEKVVLDAPDDELFQDPAYARRIKSWFSDPRRLLDWRHTMARCQALADMLEQRVRIVELENGAELPPALLAAISELRKLHQAIGILERTTDGVDYVHVDLVNALIRNTVAVVAEFVLPEHLGAALDKLRTLQQAVTADR